MKVIVIGATGTIGRAVVQAIGTPVETVARAYVQALEGSMNGEVLDAI